MGREDSFKILTTVSLAQGLKKAAKRLRCFCSRIKLSPGSGQLSLEGPAAASCVKVGRRRFWPGLSSEAQRVDEEGGPTVPAAIRPRSRRKRSALVGERAAAPASHSLQNPGSPHPPRQLQAAPLRNPCISWGGSRAAGITVPGRSEASPREETA